MKQFAVTFMLSVAVTGIVGGLLTWAQESPSPLSDGLRAEIAIAQRNYLTAKEQLEKTYGATLMAAGARAVADCKKAGLIFDADSISCKAAPDEAAKHPRYQTMPFTSPGPSPSEQ